MTDRRRKVRSTLVAVSAVTSALIACVFAVAAAHATLVSSEPSANSNVASMPARVRLVFSEPVEAGLTHLTLIDGNGQSVDLMSTSDPHDVHAVLANVDPAAELQRGQFRILWHIVSADGHPVSGSFVFSVGAVDTATQKPPPDASASREGTVWGPSIAGAPTVPALLRGLAGGCLLGLAGLLFFIVANGGNTTGPRRVALGLALATPLLFTAHLVVWLLNTSPDHQLAAAWLSSAFDSTVGRIELWRTILSVLPLWALWLARRPALALALSLPSILLSSAVGHSAAFHPAWAIPLKALHFLAIALWLGGLLWLVLRDGTEPHRARRDVARVSEVALWSVIVVTISGIAQTLILLPSIDAIRSAYGAVVLAKAAGLGVLVAFGAHHRSRIVPRVLDANGDIEIASLKTSVSRELIVFAVVILLGGLLAYLSPPRTGPADRSSSLESPS